MTLRIGHWELAGPSLTYDVYDEHHEYDLDAYREDRAALWANVAQWAPKAAMDDLRELLSLVETGVA